MRYRLLGPVAVENGQGELNLGGRRPRLLLTTFLLHPNAPVAGSTLIECLWRHDPPARASTAVRVVLAQLRRVLEPDRRRGDASILSHAAAGWVLSVPEGALDVERFEALVDGSRRASARGELIEASELGRAALAEWRGPALVDVVDDLDIAQAPARRWDEMRLEAVERTIEVELRLGRHHALIGELIGLVEQHPLRENLVGLLMVALYRAGRQAEALRVYERSRRHLVEELGIEPTARLIELERAILLQEPVLDLPGAEPERREGSRWTPPLPGPVDDVRLAGSLVGREAELDRIAPAVESVAAGRAVTVVVSGVAGIGKTRFAAEIAAACHRRGAAVLFGRCDSEPLVSYQPFVEALGGYLDRVRGDRSDPRSHASRVADTIRALTGRSVAADDQPRSDGDGAGTAPAGGGDPGDRYQLFETVTSLLREMAAGRSLVLVVDDLHWADEGTLSLIRHLHRRLDSGSILLLLTTRHDETAPDAAGAGVLAPGAASADRLVRLALGGLDGVAARDLVSQLWEGSDDEAVSGRIVELGEGNPFFLRHLVAHLLAVGPSAVDPSTFSLPTEVASLVETLLGSLSPRARLVLSVASVHGREFDLDVVAAVAGIDEGDLLDAVEELLATRLIVEDGSGVVDRYRFVHELVREVSYRQLGPSRRARLHGQVAVAIETIDESQFMVLSHHFTLAGRSGWLKAAEYARRAGDRAMAAVAFDTAVTQYERAAELAQRVDRTHGRGYVELLVALGYARMSAGDADRGRAALAEAVDRAHHLNLPELVALAVLGDSGGLDLARAEPDRIAARATVARLQDALGALPDEHATMRARVASRIASDVLMLDGAAKADAYSAEAVKLARRSGDPGALAAALHVRHQVMLPGVPPEHRLDLADEQLRCAVRGSDVDHANALWLRSIDVMELGLRDETDAMLGAYRRLMDRSRPEQRWWAAVFDAAVATARGALHEAEGKVRMAFDEGVELEQPRAGAVHAGQLFVLRWLQGRIGELGPRLDQPFPSASEELIRHASRALLLAEASETAQATAELCLLVAWSELLPDAYWWLGALAIAAEAAVVIGEPAAGVATRLLDLLSPFAGRHVVFPGFAILGPCDRYMGGLLALCGRPEEAAATLARARAMADAAGTSPYARKAAEAEARLIERVPSLAAGGAVRTSSASPSS